MTVNVTPGGRPRVFSGIQPSGSLHLGNYLGAIQNWVATQQDYESIFCVVDQHAITVEYDPEELRAATRQTVGLYLAAGLDPQQCTIFVQSHIPEHTELAWLLACVTPMGWLERMTQFKEKSAGGGERVSTGLFTYPVLMAADILLYQANGVPVGEDQKQHVELARDIATRFNRMFGEVFTIPEPWIRQVGARVMGLDDPTRKMSKSTTGQFHAIRLLDDPKSIRKAVMRAVTDSGTDVVFDRQRAGLHNLLTIYQSLSGQTHSQIEAQFAGKGYGELKKALAELTIATLEPLQRRYREATADPGYIDSLLAASVTRLRPIVEATMEAVRRAMGHR
jgi:tryptophanyl-tRNA synthetase